jgi:hypothetical protein
MKKPSLGFANANLGLGVLDEGTHTASAHLTFLKQVVSLTVPTLRPEAAAMQQLTIQAAA